MRKLTLDDIVDHRAYERERDEFRRFIIDLKRRRRVAVGDLVTLVFENTDTMRWQVQEMARAERMLSDDAIAEEIAIYNELIPDAGELSATLFVELTDEAKLREWLPKLVGIEHHVRIDLGDGGRVGAVPQDEERLTREDVTATVHYLKFPFTPEQRERFVAGPARIVIDHPAYRGSAELSSEQRAELARDFSE